MQGFLKKFMSIPKYWYHGGCGEGQWGVRLGVQVEPDRERVDKFSVYFIHTIRIQLSYWLFFNQALHN